MEQTKLTVHLLGLDVEITACPLYEENAEVVVVGVRAIPSFEAVGRLFAQMAPPWALPATGPFGLWAEALRAAWEPWLSLAASLGPSPRK